MGQLEQISGQVHGCWQSITISQIHSLKGLNVGNQFLAIWAAGMCKRERILYKLWNLLFFAEHLTENGYSQKKKSENLFWVGGFWYGSVDLPETRIFFPRPNVGIGITTTVNVFSTVSNAYFIFNVSISGWGVMKIILTVHQIALTRKYICNIMYKWLSILQVLVHRLVWVEVP